MTVKDSNTEQETLDWIKTVRALGEQIGEPGVVGNVDAIINKCIEYLTTLPSELEGVKDASTNTKAIVEKSQLDILVHDKAYHQYFSYYNSNTSKPSKLSLVGSKGSKRSLELKRVAVMSGADSIMAMPAEAF